MRFIRLGITPWVCSMTEMRCKSCGKVLAYIKAGSRIAEGVAMYCAPCNAAMNARPSDILDFLRGLAGRKS